MSLELVGITVLWIFLYGYLIVASIDFGAGFFSYYSVITMKQHIIHKIIERYLSPVWEVTNVFLVFFYIGMVGFFPETARYYGTALLRTWECGYHIASHKRSLLRFQQLWFQG